jgi:nicotinamide-nucleotide amidase
LNTFEIICVGNELLIGKTLNTNENWLAARATSLGFKVTRITTIGDDVEVIAEAVREALGRKPRFIVTTGGLGPTYDDKTLEGVAAAFDEPLVINDKALQMVKEKYEAYSRERRLTPIELTAERLKMARIPAKAEPVPNSVGTAPGVLFRSGEQYLVSLPGVPGEMKAIFDEHIAPILAEEARGMLFYEESIDVSGIMESSLAPLIEKAMLSNPYVYIKSHPKGQETIPHIEIHLSTMSNNAQTAKQHLEEAREQIMRLIKSVEQ